MATNVAERVKELKGKRIVPQRATYRTLDTGLTYREANTKEIRLRNACGAHCDGSPGGGYKAGRVWSVYRIDW